MPLTAQEEGVGMGTQKIGRYWHGTFAGRSEGAIGTSRRSVST